MQMHRENNSITNGHSHRSPFPHRSKKEYHQALKTSHCYCFLRANIRSLSTAHTRFIVVPHAKLHPIVIQLINMQANIQMIYQNTQISIQNIMNTQMSLMTLCIRLSKAHEQVF